MQATPDNPKCERCGVPLFDHAGAYGDRPTCPSPGMEEFRRGPDDMPRLGLAPRDDVPLGVYRHYKGGLYVVLGGALDATAPRDSICVVYQSALEGYLAVRAIHDFTRTLLVDGKHVRRFEQVIA